MTLSELYEDIIEKLKKDQRPLIKLDQEREQELKQKWQESLEAGEREEIKKILCVLDHAQKPSSAFEELFAENLEVFEDTPTLIYTLGASSKHVIIQAQMKGNQISSRFTKALLDKLSSTQDPELLEWILRTIEQYGATSIRFKEEVLKRRPSFLAFLNPHKKNSKDIIDLLEKRWNALVKGL